MSRLRRRWPLTGSALSSRLAQWTQPGLIQSVQTGSIQMASVASNAATITAVDVSRSMLLFLGQSFDTAGPNPSASNAKIVLTNGTTVTATSAASGTNTIRFTVVQFFPGVIKSIQRGTISNGATTATAAINPVATLKSWVAYLGSTTSVSDDRSAVRLDLTNATTVTSTRDASSTGTTITSYEAVELY